MDDRIVRELDGLIEREGGFVDHRDDRGGATCWGITIAVARSAGYWGTMATLPRSFALGIYRERYWLQPGFDQVAQLAPDVAYELFDTGVNMGPAVAARFLQRALNALNRRERDWTDIVVDGRIGPATLNALRCCIAHRGQRAGPVLLRMLNALQGARYIELAEARPANESFVFGWFDKRVA